MREKFGVGPDKVIEVQALCGDTVDNVPGVPGIGVKTAAELINAYGDLETLLARAAEIKQPKRRQALIDNRRAGAAVEGAGQARRRGAAAVPAVGARSQAATIRDKLFPFLDEMELRALKTRIAPAPVGDGAGGGARASASRRCPPVPRFTAPRSYELIDTAEGLDRWIAAAYEAGTIAVWPMTSAVAGATAGTRRDRAGAVAGPRRLCPAGAPAGGELDLAAASSELAPDTALERLRPLLADPGVLKIGHDVKTAAHLLAALRHRAGALRLHDADVLRARRRAVRPRDREPGAARPSSTS